MSLSGFAPWQSDVFDRAVQAFREGRLGHALLLAGPAHMGKGEVAEALAKRMLCQSSAESGFACGLCRSCQLFPAQIVELLTTQAHPDLQRVTLEPNEKREKLKSEISVDQVRRLGEWFSMTSQMGNAQVAIIYPADLMNSSSANALLKTLEEPSQDRFILLVTSRPERLPATVRSRCQRLDFRMPPVAAALEWLALRGFVGESAVAALHAARGNPGLACEGLQGGGMQVRKEVIEQMNAIASGRSAPLPVAQSWLAGAQAEQRLRFAADLALDAAARRHGDASRAAPGLTAPGLATASDFHRLSRWFDEVNRTRERLRDPVRNDLVLAGLLREWRTMFQTG